MLSRIHLAKSNCFVTLAPAWTISFNISANEIIPSERKASPAFAARPDQEADNLLRRPSKLSEYRSCSRIADPWLLIAVVVALVAVSQFCKRPRNRVFWNMPAVDTPICCFCASERLSHLEARFSRISDTGIASPPTSLTAIPTLSRLLIAAPFVWILANIVLRRSILLLSPKGY